MRFGKKIKIKIKSDKTFQNNFERLSIESNFEYCIVLLKKDRTKQHTLWL